MSLGKFRQSAVDRKKYTIDYSDWLAEGETLSSATFSADIVTPPALTFTKTINPPYTTIVVFIEGGVTGNNYKCSVTAVTSTGQIKKDSFYINVQEP